MGKYELYSKSFIKEIVKFSHAGKSVSDLSKEYKISEKIISEWTQQEFGNQFLEQEKVLESKSSTVDKRKNYFEKDDINNVSFRKKLSLSFIAEMKDIQYRKNVNHPKHKKN